jgi:hypothetical protein
MILISNGLPKSGTSLTFLYTMFLFKEHFGTYSEEAVAAAIENGRLKGHAKRFIHKIGMEELQELSNIARHHGPVLIKTHTAPNAHLVEAIKDGRAHMTYVDRDPRDMMLSAIDFRERTKNAQSPMMQEFKSVQDSIQPIKYFLNVACQWLESGIVYRVQYRDLLTEPHKVIAGIMQHLGITINAGIIDKVIEREYTLREVGKWQFNRGILTRFHEEMSLEELELCNHELGDYIERMGYIV